MHRHLCKHGCSQHGDHFVTARYRWFGTGSVRPTSIRNLGPGGPARRYASRAVAAKRGLVSVPFFRRLGRRSRCLPVAAGALPVCGLGVSCTASLVAPLGSRLSVRDVRLASPAARGALATLLDGGDPFRLVNRAPFSSITGAIGRRISCARPKDSPFCCTRFRGFVLRGCNRTRVFGRDKGRPLGCTSCAAIGHSKSCVTGRARSSRGRPISGFAR